MAYPEKPSDASLPLLHWREGAVAYLRFNRPQSLNAIDRAMARAFLQACRDLAADSQVRAVCIAGEGRAFMAGGDVADMRREPEAVSAELIEGMHGGLKLLAALDAPVVAQVHGAVAGAGLGVALACDLVVAAEGTRFSVAYPLIGASCDCSTSWGLPRAVGLRKAMEMALLSEPIDASQALSFGLVNRVVPAAALAGECARLLQRLADGPTRAYGRMKALLRGALERNFEGQLDAERAAFLQTAGTSDFIEGVGAFVDKRPPRFTGR